MEDLSKPRSSSITSIASIEELGGEVGDLSLHRAGELINLSKCEDETFISNAYKYCQRCLGGSWALCSADDLSVEYLSGGMTNYLYLCSLAPQVKTEPGEPRKVKGNSFNNYELMPLVFIKVAQSPPPYGHHKSNTHVQEKYRKAQLMEMKL